jgi:hypothetical protein
VLRRGEIVLVSTVAEVRRLWGRVVRVQLARETVPITLPGGMTFIERGATQWQIRVEGEVGPLLPLLAGLPVRDLEDGRAGARGRARTLLPRAAGVTGVLALLAHSLRRQRGLLLAVCALLFAFQILLILVARGLEETGGFAQLESLIPDIVREWTNIPALSFRGMVSFAYSHPVVPRAAPWPAPRVILSLAANLSLIVLAWGGIALCVASLARRRGAAAGAAGVLVLATFILDAVGRLWAPLREVARVSPFHYHSPFPLIAGAPLPGRDVAALAGTFVAGCAAAYLVYQRRDL